MGIDSDRVVVSSRNAARRNLSCSNSESISKKRELSKLSSEMMKKPSNKTAKSAVYHSNKSPVEGNCKQKAPKRSFNRSETEKWNMDYIKGDKSFTGLNSLESVVPKSSRSLNEVFPRKAKTSISSDKTPKWSEQDNSVNFSFAYPHSPYSTSRNHLNLHSSSSAASLSSGESPNSVLWKKGNSSISKNINSPSGCKGESILSFGNIYRSPSRGRDLHRNNTFPSYKSSSVDCKGSRIIQPNAHVLGLGGCNYGHGNIIKSTKSCWNSQVSSRYMNVRELKDAGNEEYRRSRFLEAISLYDQAIALNPQNAPCHYNKAAALAGLGRYANAVGECLEAIKCDPSYKPPHYRLGTIYTRLGRVEDAKWHFELSGQHPGSDSMKNILHLEAHLLNMKKAQQLEDWNHVLSESNLAIKAGADASNQVLSYKAESLLKLHRAKEALEVLIEAKELQGTRSKKMHRGDSCLLIIESQIYMYLGRFDDGVKAAEQAVNMDSGLKSLMWLRKAQAIADARRKGNEHFKAEKYLEACEAYGQGLEHAPLNSVLLTNRAACWSKLGQWEKAIKDCTSALENRPDYTKPLLWRAHSYAKLVRWEESVRDYKTLNQLRPGDRSIAHSLYQVELELKMAQQRVCESRRNAHITHVNVRSQFLNPIKLTGKKRSIHIQKMLSSRLVGVALMSACSRILNAHCLQQIQGVAMAPIPGARVDATPATS